MIAKQQEASNSASAAGLNRQELGEGLILLTETGERGMARTVETGAQSRERQRKAKELGEMGARTAFKLRAAKGLAHMGSGQYEAAAREFINMDGKLEDWEGKVNRMKCRRDHLCQVYNLLSFFLSFRITGPVIIRLDDLCNPHLHCFTVT